MHTYTVQPNDTPALIAAKMAGDAYRFPELIAANPHKTKMRHNGMVTFADMSPGEQLYMPATWKMSGSKMHGVGRAGGGGGGSAAQGSGSHAARGGSSRSSSSGSRGAHAAAQSGSHVVPSTHRAPQVPAGGGNQPSPPPSGGGGGGGGNLSPPAPPGPGLPHLMPPNHPGPPGGAPPAPPGHLPFPGPGPHPHHPPHFGHGHGWGGWGWGNGWWNGDWWPVYYGVTEAQVDACSWAAYGSTASWPEGGSQLALTRANALRASGMKPGEVQFFRFADASGIFQFYLAKDGTNIQVDRCDDGIVGVGKGVGQNYIWDRYPGEVDPETPAHTLSVGLSGVGVDGAGVDGCCGQTSMEPASSGHHPACDWEWGTCACEILGWNSSSALDDPGCVYQEPNYGSTQIHLKAGVGPLGPVGPVGVGQGLGQGQLAHQSMFLENGQLRSLHHGLGQVTNPDGTVTIGDITYTPPTTGPSVPGWGFPAPGTPGTTTITPEPGGGSVVTSTTIPTDPPVQLPPANQTQPGTIPPGLTPTWGNYPTPTTTPASVVAVAAPTSTGMLVVGLAAVALGLGGIAYLAHVRATGAP